ncbi:hypothetical protein BH11PSE12_BH11PSE12_24310 [soil metagenome]
MRLPLFYFSQIFLAASLLYGAVAQADNSTNLPPSADLHYSIQARQSHLPLSGEAFVKWQLSGTKGSQKYSVITETRAMLVGKILDASSYGTIDSFGLAPDKFVEKRYGKAESVSQFDRISNTIRFTESAATYPIKGGEQDRTSATWQLVALARAMPEKFITGSEWKMLVAGRRDADPWSFKVAGKDTLRTAIGDVATVHFIKAPPPDSKDQQIELWLAPALEWYPVRLKFSDADGDFVDQTISSIKK